MKIKKTDLIASVLLTVAAVGFTFLVKTINVAPSEELRKGKELYSTEYYQKKGKIPEVGFATINNDFHGAFSYNEPLHKISEYAGYLPVITVAIFGFLGIYQSIKRRSIFKADKGLWLMGIFYICLACLYFLFEKITINYRPVVLDGELEASFPSTHTLLAMSLCFSTIIYLRYFYEHKSWVKGVNIALAVFAVLIVVMRLLSGVHWLTDIAGGIIISIALLAWLRTFLFCLRKPREKKA